jgi:hypothetical protein
LNEWLQGSLTTVLSKASPEIRHFSTIFVLEYVVSPSICCMELVEVAVAGSGSGSGSFNMLLKRANALAELEALVLLFGSLMFSQVINCNITRLVCVRFDIQ